jgi:hypothetical protein
MSSGSTDLFRALHLGQNGRQVESLEGHVRDLESEDLAGFDAVMHLARVCNHPVVS